MRWLSVLIVTILLVACGGSKLQPVPNDGVILAFGDSLTYGTGTTRENSYPKVLAELSGRQVVNEGIAGEVTAEGLARLPAVLAETNPSLVILCYGGNDILQRKSKTQAKQNLVSMIELIQQSGAEVMLVAVPQFGLFLSAAEFIDEAAEQTGVAYEANLIPDLMGDKSIKSDTVHFNAAGYRLLAEGLYQRLQGFGAL